MDMLEEAPLGAMGLLGTDIVPEEPDMLPEPESDVLPDGTELGMGAELLVIGFEDAGFDEEDALFPQQPEKSTKLNTKQSVAANNFLGKIQTSFRPCKLPAQFTRSIVNCRSRSSQQ
ncbi:MAG: hypothetical protein RR415_11215 [Ruthenibacterium sp.]